MPETIPSSAADAAERAIATAGGSAALAKLIGVNRWAVHQWKRSGIPANRLPAVARITGIPMSELRPDLWADLPVAEAV